MGYIPQASDWSKRAVILTSIFNKELEREGKSKEKVKGIILFSVCILIIVILIS